MRVHKLRIAEVGKSCNPITLKIMGDAFDSAWGQVVDQFSACDVRAAQRARLVWWQRRLLPTPPKPAATWTNSARRGFMLYFSSIHGC